MNDPHDNASIALDSELGQPVRGGRHVDSVRADRQSPSRLYFGSSRGECWLLPDKMSADVAAPKLIFGRCVMDFR